MKLCKNIIAAVFFALLSPISHAQTDTLQLDAGTCRQLALHNSYRIKIAALKTGLAGDIRKSVNTRYYGELALAGQYQYTNRQIGLFDRDMFLPVVPFWAIDEQTGTLRTDILENPLLNGIVANPLTGEIFYDNQGNPAFLLYSYLPSEQLKFGNHHNVVFGPSFVQPIYLGGKIRNMAKVARAGEEIMKLKQDIDIAEVVYKTEEAYWRCVDVQEKKNLAYAYRDLLVHLVEDVENYYAEGIITYSDVLKARVKLNEAELDCLKADNGYKLACMALMQIIGLPAETAVHLDADVSDIPLLPNQAGGYEMALNNREELKILEQTRLLTEAQNNMARSRFLPNITASANYLFFNPNPYNGFRKEFGSDWSAGITLQIPLFHWGDRIHTLRATQKMNEISLLMRAEAEELIRLELEQAWFMFSESLTRYNLCKQAVKHAAENLRMAHDAWMEGIIKSGDLIEAQVLWQKACTELIAAKTDLKMQEVNYRKKTGTLVTKQ